MDIRQNLLKEPRREKGGKLAVKRFKYQAAWGLARILQLYMTGADFGISFEFHDDVLELDSRSSLPKVTLFQVNTAAGECGVVAALALTSSGTGRSRPSRSMTESTKP